MDELKLGGISATIRDNDGMYGVGFRKTIAVMAMALVGEGVETRKVHLAIETTLQAYVNGAGEDAARWSEMLGEGEWIARPGYALH